MESKFGRTGTKLNTSFKFNTETSGETIKLAVDSEDDKLIPGFKELSQFFPATCLQGYVVH
jgi:hypothetical protein